MILKNEDINLLIKIKDLIIENEKEMLNTTAAKSDFAEFTALIDRATENKQKASEKANKYNKANKEYHRITCNMAHCKKNGNMEKYEYWKQQLMEYKQKKEVK